jgi:DNA-binding IclR family transcriptional regulator
MYVKVLEILQEKGTPLTKEEIAEKTGLPITKVALNLLRLREEGKVQSTVEDEKTLWSVKEESDDKKKMEKRVRD